MKKLFLASILSFTALCATEESVPDEKNVWDERGAYVKYGLGSEFVFPVFPTLGFGYYGKIGEDNAVDFSVMLNAFPCLGSVNAKLLALPVVKENFQFGIGPSYSYVFGLDCLLSDYQSLGIGFLFRKTNLYNKRFFQVEVNQPILLTCGFVRHTEWIWQANFKVDGVPWLYLPGISITWGHRF